ncbi:MAG: mRNA surveillance protein pelota [Candidatus Thermoplasmatota archaeon]|nr:mRNA surveillance protein pelota [Candidatus Thermoplasmatota archaeon]
MRIIERNDARGLFKVRVDSMDDLWYLHQALQAGTVVGAHTYRKPEAKEDQVRADSQPRVRVYLRITVSTSEFHPFTDVLRVRGTVIEGPPEISGHHTFNVDVGTVLDLEFSEGSTEVISVLEDAQRNARGTMALAVSMDDETADLFRLRDYGMERIGTVRTQGGGKWTGKEGGWDGYYREIADIVARNLGEGMLLIISGPGFFKESLAKLLREEGTVDGPRIHVLQSSSAGPAGIREALGKGGSVSRTLEGLRFVQENELLEEFMARIGRGRGATYGLDEVRKALSNGAVEVLLISERLFREGPGKLLMGAASETSSRTLITSTSHELGDMLDRMGGVGALLRFDV